MNASAVGSGFVAAPAAVMQALDGRERARRRIVMLVLGTFVLLLCEGVLRKWMLPSYGRWLFFVRDPFVIAAYVIALVAHWWPSGRGFLTFGMSLAAAGLLLVALQLMSGSADSQLLLGVYGWRNYFLYIPLTFLIAATFRQRDVALLVKLTLLAAPLIAALVFIQFFSPPGAPINVGTSDDIALQFKGLALSGLRTRPMGPFTSDVGQREFTVLVTVLVTSQWLLPRARRIVPLWMLLAGTAAAFTCLALGGSRGAAVHVGIAMLVAGASAFLARGGAAALRALLLPALLVVLTLVLYPLVFPDGYAAFTERWNSAAVSETQAFEWGIFGRALYGLIDFLNLIGSVPLIGYGLGLAGNASLTLGIRIEGFTGWAETDWARHMVDLGPILGIAFIAFRVGLVAWLLKVTVAATRARAEPLPLMLFTFASIDLLQGQITGHGSVNGFVWIFAGVALAAAAAPPAPATAALPHAAPPVPYPNLMP